MARYFLEVAYKGTAYSGFQSQENARTIQEEIEIAFKTLQRDSVSMTGSSRTDAGVHARQNFFHFDYDQSLHEQFVYKMNAILPADIVISGVKEVADDAHCRFDALNRTYCYYLYKSKDPFLEDRAWYFPYPLNYDLLQQAAALLLTYQDFTSFSKRNTQVKTFICQITESKWIEKDKCLVYTVRANRFLRGMVRALVSTMLLVGRGKLTIEEFKAIIESKDCTKASFAAPAHGLFLEEVSF
ncbi:MAG TPA: tRNA pseudouridine(38-40) synthase TruA [Chitinophagaceae bacterium]|nr:tRNA pseudouridine(38-40) synthase TruA [Chitinophagaceae bacterium]HAL94870.1 tRNA pseudouridine(38-40) synthase TruA [Chitinophagaceae bacterium]